MAFRLRISIGSSVSKVIVLGGKVHTNYQPFNLTEMLWQVNWYPELLYTIDVCESEEELYILELGSFSCAGEYGCDLSLIVEAGAKAAREDYEAVNT